MSGMLVVILIGIILMGIFILWLWSPGKVEPLRGNQGEVLAGSISEIVRTQIGGVEQGMIIKGKSIDNPVLLFLHGGPGNPEYVLSEEYKVGLEELFTVCWWEQRGTGMSYSSSIQKGSMTLDQMIADTVEVTNYLRKRFGQGKIYVMGHSWGTFLGTHVVARYPELYSAYMGIGQVTNQFESEKMAYDLMLSIALENKDLKTVDKLKEHTLNTPNDITMDYLMVRSDLLNKYGYGVFHKSKSKMELLMPILKAKEYTLKDKYGYAMGSLVALEEPMNQSVNTINLNESIQKLLVPVYIFHGVYDQQVSFELSLDYFEALDAPEKHFYAFENSAHSPFLEEPEKFIKILKEDVVAGLNSR